MNNPALAKKLFGLFVEDIFVGTVGGVIFGLLVASVALSISVKVAFAAPKKLAPRLSIMAVSYTHLTLPTKA